jgi:hypothetical protein
MFNAVLEFAMQLSVLYPLVGMFILIDLLLWAIRTRRFNEARERREADRLRNEERRERRKLGERPVIPSRATQPVSTRRAAKPAASLAGVAIHRAREKPVFGRRTGL